MTHHVGLDGAVGGGVGDAGEDEAVAHLVVIEEGLVGLVDGTGLLRLGRVAWARGEAVSARPNVRRSFILNCGYNVFFGGSGSASSGRLEVLTVTLPAQEEQAPARQE